jgi:arsenate reductase (thioredoxin)
MDHCSEPCLRVGFFFMGGDAKKRVLFLCTGNSCRSQMAEAMLRHMGGEHFDAFSAGSHPAGFVHQIAIDTLKRLNIPLGDATSKSWEEFAESELDLVITVCDAAAGESCPVWPGSPMKAHWSLPDPVYHTGSDEDRLAFALAVAERLRTKIKAMIELDWSMDHDELQRRLAFLGDI